MLPHEIIWDLTFGVAISRAIQVVAELGVADAVADDPVPAEKVAAACGADAYAIERILRLLSTRGVFERSDGGYRHTDASRLLRSDEPMSLRAFARMAGMPAMVEVFGNFEHSARTGRPSAELLEPGGLWGYLEAHPDQAGIFGEAMTAKAQADIAAVLQTYDFGQFGTIADIGGGRGHLLRAVLDAAPGARGVLFDQPSVIERLEIGRDRLTTQAGDFFTGPLPGADAYILMDIIHDWGDDDALAILRSVRAAAAPGARLLILEDVLPDDEPDPAGYTLDVVMLVATGGRERTAAELSGLLAGAGFRPGELLSTPSRIRVLEATAV